MKKAVKVSLAVAAIVLLAACGGSDQAPASPMSKYAGTYYLECSRGGDESSQTSIKVNDLGSGNFAFQQITTTFNNGACSGDGQSADDMGSGTITVLGTEKFKFSNFAGSNLPPSICATKNEEVTVDLVKITFSIPVPDFYFYKINSYFFPMAKIPNSNFVSGSVTSTDRNFSTDSFIDCSDTPV